MKKNLLLIFTCFSIIDAMQNEQLESLINAFKGKVGIHAVNLQTQQVVSKNALESFPMASTRKIILASFIFDQIEKQKLNLNQTVLVTQEDRVPGTGVIKDELLAGAAKTYSIKKLLEVMMRDSDNIAADKLMALGGGYIVIDGWLNENGIMDITFKTDIRTWLFKQARKTIWYHEAQQTLLNNPQVPWYFKAIAYALSWRTEPETIDFSDEDTNICTPQALTQFIISCYEGKAPGLGNKEHRDLLFEFMKNCNTGKNRIPLHLSDTTVFHKTGSGIIGIVNDAGVIESATKGAIALTIFIKDSTVPVAQIERVVADIALQVYNAL